MKIIDIRVRTCSIPIEAPTRHSYASPSFYTRTIVELISDEEVQGQPLIGLGETYGTVAASAFEPLRPFLIGADPFDLQRLLIQIRQRGYISRQPMLAAPIEFACLDLQGKAIGRPVYQLLGGKEQTQPTIQLCPIHRLAPTRSPRTLASIRIRMVVSPSAGTVDGLNITAVR